MGEATATRAVRTPRLGQALALAGVLWLGPTAVGIAVPPLAAAAPLLAVGAVIALGRCRGLPPDALGLRRVPARALLAAVPLGLGLVAVNLGSGVLLRALGATAVAGTGAGDLLPGGLDTVGVVALLVSAALIAPLVEELLFRGLLQPALSARLGPAAGLWLTAGLFTLAHGSAGGVFHLVAGLAYGLVARRAGSIWPAVVVHGLNNAAAVLLVAVFL